MYKVVVTRQQVDQWFSIPKAIAMVTAGVLGGLGTLVGVSFALSALVS